MFANYKITQAQKASSAKNIKYLAPVTISGSNQLTTVYYIGALLMFGDFGKIL